jgi:FixJ family two-component response regulator
MARTETASEEEPTVVIMDDDAAVRESLIGLLRSVGLRVRPFSSAQEFREAEFPDGPVCLVLDIRLPGGSGLDLQRELLQNNIPFPIIFITGHGDIPMSVQAMKGGALEFLTKPFREQDLLDAIQLGLARDSARRQQEKALALLRERFEALTAREREVMLHVVRGQVNKQIAGELGIGEFTVKVHRGQVMHKMKAASLPDLTRMADKLNLA